MLAKLIQTFVPMDALKLPTQRTATKPIAIPIGHPKMAEDAKGAQQVVLVQTAGVREQMHRQLA